MGVCLLNRVTHALVFSAGWVCFALGAIGVVLPVLPTTPFMLLAAGCFAKTSPKFHRWLLTNRIFGPLIKNWQQEGYIEPRTKRRALIIIALTFGSSIAIVDVVGLRWMLLGFWCACSFMVSRLPTIPRSQRNPQNEGV